MEWKDQLLAEFDRAVQVRSQGNEGQARVCARRAAGIAIREYSRRKGIIFSSPSAYDLLKWVGEQPDFSADIQRIAALLTLRVDESFNLPVEEDLVAEARRLCELLLPDLAEET